MSPAPPAALRRTHRQSGQILVLLALVLVVLLGISALVIDLGYAYYTQRSLQASADAAALAGASGLPDSSTAVDRAREYAGSPGGKNRRGNIPPVQTEVTMRCISVAPCNPVNAIVVVERTVVPTKFARVLGFDEIEVSARATACSPCGSRPLDVMLVLDRTGSMCMTHSGAFDPSCTDLENAREGMLEFVSFMDPTIDRIGLAVLPPALGSRCSTPSGLAHANYNSTSSSYVLVPLSDDFKTNGELNRSSQLVSTIECVRAGGVTSYATALEKAQGELAAHGRPEAPDVIVFLSDGAANYGPSYYSNSSNYRRRPCRQGVTSAGAIKSAGTTIYSIGYDLDAQNGGANVCESFTGADESPSITAYEALRQIASDSSTFFNKPAPGDLSVIYTTIASEIGGARLVDDGTQ